MTDEFWTYSLLAITALLAGAINAIAGGGTLLTFPTLTSVMPFAAANATSTCALFPGSIAGALAYRSEVKSCRKFILRMFVPSLVGGFLGARLVTEDKEAFRFLVPWLILSAAVLFLIQQPVSQWLRRHKPDHEPGPAAQLALITLQFLISLYGGYFGAGIGILMLATLSLMGIANIHQANGVKTLLAAVINSASVGAFFQTDLIIWRYAWVMAVASIIGGYGGARLARRLPQVYVRWVVIIIGFTLATFYFMRQFANGE